MDEEAVFSQELSADEMEAAAGGADECVQMESRDFYFVGCAATVEADSWCNMSDACYAFAVHYIRMIECSRAWE